MSTTDLERSYAKGFVVSKDGTTIGYRQFGKGTGVILVHGGMKTSQDFMKLAVALSDSFTVYAVDRRGRGLSGTHGDEFSVDKEVDDMQALIAETGARSIFGLSAGARGAENCAGHASVGESRALRATVLHRRLRADELARALRTGACAASRPRPWSRR